MPTLECHESIKDVVDCLLSTAADKGIAAFVTVAASLPLWHSYLKEVSEFATLLLPWVGLSVGAIQIYVKTLEARERRQRLADHTNRDSSRRNIKNVGEI